MYYPDAKPDKDITRKENYRQISFMNIDTKILIKVLPNQVQTYKKDNAWRPNEIYPE